MCVYFRITTAPSAANTIIQCNDTSAFTTQIASIELNSDRTLQLRDEDGTIGSVSSAIPLTDFEHYIELKIDQTGGAGASIVEARLDGTVFATSSTRSLSAGILTFNLGGNLNAEAQTQGSWHFDDLVINDSTGSYSNTYPGNGGLVCIRPTGDSSVAWTRSGTDSGANWSQLDETPPNDVTDYVTSNTLDQIDLYTLADTPAAVASDDTIIGVFPGIRFAVDDATGSDPDFTIGLSSGGNVDECGTQNAGAIGYRTNDGGGALVNHLVLANNSNYEQPATSTAYTKTVVDALLYRLRESATDTHFVRVSAVWVYVHHKPAGAVATRKFQRASVLG
jgi:hypothetical protein